MADNEEIFAKISESLALQYDVIYYVNMKDCSFVEFVNNPIYGEFKAEEDDDNFFKYAIKNGGKLVYSADKDKVFRVFSHDNVVELMNESKRYSFKYRLVINGKKQYNRTTIVWDADHENLIFGVEDITEETLREISGYAVAWLTVDDTKIDYPLCQCDDNKFFLNHDPQGNYSLAGSIFLDFRNNPDFTDRYTWV